MVWTVVDEDEGIEGEEVKGAKAEGEASPGATAALIVTAGDNVEVVPVLGVDEAPVSYAEKQLISGSAKMEDGAHFRLELEP